MAVQTRWQLESGATLLPDGVRFGVWAPNAERVEVQIEDPEGPAFHPLERESDGLHAGTVPGLTAGARYRYRLGGGSAFPDPYSRFQPEGVHGPSEVIDPSAFRWTDEAWPGLTPAGLVIYELHVGTYTEEGTYEALIGKLEELKRLGITAIELMPVAECPGRWNWGYDGVDLYAPSHNYGRPDDLRRLVDAAHRVGLGVILDVVYNHLGPDGNYLRVYANDYFTDRHKTIWGDALNYDGPNNRRVRDFAIDNACYWLTEFHLDGLRLDATDAIADDSLVHLLQELGERARAAAARPVVIIAEEARNEVRTIRPIERGGCGLDGVWADDFHHEVRVHLTGERGGYLDNHAGTTEDIARAITGGFVYQGQPTLTTGKPKGTRVTDEPATAFVFTIQNHDQVGNRAYGERIHHDIDPGRYAVASALLLFAPETPLLFMGQEFAASAPFMYFTDHEEELGKLVTAGRREEFKGFRAFADPALREGIPDPQAEETFRRSKLNLGERETNAGLFRLYQDLLRLRREDPVLRVQDRPGTRAEALSAQIVAVHRRHGDEHRLLLANFGPAVSLPLAGTPFLASLPGGDWRLLLSTAETRFGGSAAPAALQGNGNNDRVEIPTRSAAIFGIDGEESTLA